jgi:hypothetical protein
MGDLEARERKDLSHHVRAQSHLREEGRKGGKAGRKLKACVGAYGSQGLHECYLFSYYHQVFITLTSPKSTESQRG